MKTQHKFYIKTVTNTTRDGGDEQTKSQKTKLNVQHKQTQTHRHTHTWWLQTQMMLR